MDKEVQAAYNKLLKTYGKKQAIPCDSVRRCSIEYNPVYKEYSVLEVITKKGTMKYPLRHQLIQKKNFFQFVKYYAP